MIRYYWIKYEKDPHPIKIAVKDWQDFVYHYLDMHILIERGPIEWLIRD